MGAAVRMTSGFSDTILPMNLETLWAPWRLGYVQGHDKGVVVEPTAWRPGADTGCFLCRAAAAESADDRALGVLERTSRGIVVINRFPYSNGHLLVAPLDHKASLAVLDDDHLLDLQHGLVRWCRIIEGCMQAQGFNVGVNVGAVAGAGLPGHLHWHVVPRWTGDVNFMPTVAGARVLPQALDSLWEQLTAARAAGQG
jgi:ATP adenylyltransferase